MDPSQPLDNPRHEAFAREWAKGKSGTEAYIAAGYDAKNADANATRFMGNDGIRARKEWFQEQAAKGTVLTIKEKREFLAAVVRTPIGEVDERSPLAQSVRYSDTGKEIKMPDKLAAIRADDNLAGDGSEAGKNDVLSDWLASFMHTKS